jgi:3-hydroxyacyl-CoA dehydrogenase/3a,7a,12a-trihydroxy-5b-cholest-24-enoyl-CoA hydratase
MSNSLRFDGRVVIITGAGNGLGRSHALLFGSRGAKVVVNDLGGSAHGDGKSASAADNVVAEIKALGGEAVANHDSVEDGDKIVQTAMDAFGRIDVVVNNAGILRDVTFQKMTDADWDLIYRVHVRGAYKVTHAAWNYMRDHDYGRILFTASAAGIYGNFGQTNYAMAKLGLVGFASSLAIEGRKKNIRVNTIAPIAGSRMTETVLPKDLVDALRPEFVSPLVAWLAHESCEETGGLFEVGGGFVGKLRWQRTEGKAYKLARPLTPEAIQKDWATVTDFARATAPTDITSSMQPILGNLGTAKSRGGNDFIDVDEALAASVREVTSSYDERDLALYALGIGAAKDPADTSDLSLVYELHGDGFKAVPTYGVIPVLNSIMTLAKQGKSAPGLHYGFDRILHGEHYLEIKRPLPPKATLTHKMKVKDVFDKGKNALVVMGTTTYDEKGNELAYNEMTTVVRGAGGWGGDRGPQGDVNVAPDRAPDAVVTEKTDENQALLYRLSGDWNPLHADASFATAFGFKKPILHGLCTFGFAARHVIKSFAKNADPRYFKSIKVRFADSVFPGETLKTEMWKESATRVVFRVKVAERDAVVISNAAIEFYDEIPKEKAALAPPPTAAAPTTAPSAASGPTSSDIFAAIRLFLEKTPDLVSRVQTTFQFKLTSPESATLIDVKNGKGAVTEGTGEKPDVTLELSDADFLAMCTGKADAQKLYFGGKLKISGNVMASQKLEFLKKLDPELVRTAMGARGGSAATSAAGDAAPAAKAAPPAAAATKTPKAPAIFAAVKERLAKNPGLAAEVGAVLSFKITAPDATWTLDLKNGATVQEGAATAATTTITLTDDDLAALAGGESPQSLYQHGKLRVEGDLRPAHKLAFFKS